jgi:hypothetical protein
MTHLYKRTSMLLLAALLCITAFSQSILNPNDPVITYNPSSPPLDTSYNRIQKWVRTVRMGWNTDAYKAYLYNGVAFRLRYPKTYNPTANDGKKYPMLVFFHGLGEASPNTDNEFHLLWGAEYFSQSVENGTFDGYVLFLQSQGGWGGGHYDYVRDISNYMIQNNKLDPFRVVVNGLSSGGQGSWEMFFKYPTYVSAVMPMSSVSIWYRGQEIVNKVKYTPFWNVHGGQDGSPSPYTAFEVRDSMLAAGANYRNTIYPQQAHDTWLQMWDEPDYWPFVTRAYSSNPWPLYGKTVFQPGETINVTIGITAGYDAYEWRRNGVLIPGATGNTIIATQTGLYDARVRRGTLWSDWSPAPVNIRVADANTPPVNIRIQAENYTTMSGIQTEPTQDVGGGLNVGWQDNNDWMDYTVTVPYAGTYNLNFRIASQFNTSQFQLRSSTGQILAAVNVPNTGYFQTWQTISTSCFLNAGTQTIRIYTVKTSGGWNFNWWEITNGTSGPTPTNTPPTANAGTAQTITLPVSSVTLNGSGTDADGVISAYAWSQVSGPANAVFSAPSSASTNATGLVAGTYVFRLTVTDNGGATATSDVTITVNPAPSTGPTTRIQAENYSAMSGIQVEGTSDVGGGQNIGWQDTGDWMDYAVNVSSAGTYTVNFRVATMFNGPQFQLRNSGGTALATLNVPNTGGFQNWQTISAQVSLPAGQQTLRIYTSRASGGWNINWWEIVGTGGGTPPANTPPTVNAGSNQTITLPTNTVTLNGSATDAEGAIASYAWSYVSGPAGSSFATPNAASTVVNGLAQGVYVFRLTATDGGGLSGFANVTVTVNAQVTTGPSIRIEAENYVAMSGIRLEGTADAGGGQNVAWIDDTDWMDYTVNVPASGTYRVNFRVATEKNGPPQFQLRTAGGSVLTTINVPNTGGFQNWTTVSANITLAAGSQTFRIYCTRASGGWNINWWELVQQTGTVTAINPALTGVTATEARIQPERLSNSFDVYPNPVLSTAQLEVANEYSGIMVVDVINMNGSKVKAFSIVKPDRGSFRTTLALDGLQRGSYLLRISMKDWVQTRKIVKQ